MKQTQKSARAKLEPQATHLALIMKSAPRGSESYIEAMWELVKLFAYTPINETDMDTVEDNEDLSDTAPNAEMPSDLCCAQLPDKQEMPKIPKLEGSVLLIQALRRMYMLEAKFSGFEAECAVQHFCDKYICGIGVEKTCIDNYQPDKGPFEHYLRRSANRYFTKYFVSKMKRAKIEFSLDDIEEDHSSNQFADRMAVEVHARRKEREEREHISKSVIAVIKEYFDNINSIDRGKHGTHIDERKLLSYHVWYALEKFNKTEVYADKKIIEAIEILRRAGHPEYATYPSEQKIAAAKKALETADERNLYFFKRLNSVEDRVNYLWDKPLFTVCEYQNTDYRYLYDSDVSFLEILFDRLRERNVEDEQYLSSKKDWANKVRLPKGWLKTIITRIHTLRYDEQLNEKLRSIYHGKQEF